jgi:hypothetical protein
LILLNFDILDRVNSKKWTSSVVNFWTKTGIINKNGIKSGSSGVGVEAKGGEREGEG